MRPLPSTMRIITAFVLLPQLNYNHTTHKCTRVERYSPTFWRHCHQRTELVNHTALFHAQAATLQSTNLICADSAVHGLAPVSVAKMRRTVQSLFSLLFTFTFQFTSVHAQNARKATSEEALVEGKPPGTVFHGQDVPPIVTLSGPTYADTIEVGYW